MSRESTAIRRGCGAAESGRSGSAEESPAVDCMEAETEQSGMEENRKGHRKAKYRTEMNSLKHERVEQSRAIHTKAIRTTTTSCFMCVISWRWRDAPLHWNLCACFRSLGRLGWWELFVLARRAWSLADFITKLMQPPRREQRVQLLFSALS